MEREPHRKHHRTVPIRKRHTDSLSARSTSNVEGTFIPMTSSLDENMDFINTRFTEDEDEEESRVIDLQLNEKPVLFLLFPDLCHKDKERLRASTSTTQVAQILKGKKADFSLLKPLKKLNPEQSRLPPLVEIQGEEFDEDEELS